MYVITGADGQLSGQIIDNVLQEADGDEVTVTSPAPERIPAERLARWQQAGVTVKKADYSDPDELLRAFDGADVGFIISGMIVGEVRQGHHRNAIDAFAKAGVDRVVYSSFLGADSETTTQVVTVDHHATELYLQESGLTWNVFRDNLYLENYLFAFSQIALAEGRWRTCAGDERASLVAKSDCAAVGAALVLGRGERNRGYDVTGRELVSVHELCDLVSERSGVEIVYDSMPEDELYAYYDSLHIPRQATGDFSRSPYKWCSEDIVTNEAAIRDGVMSTISTDVELLTGRAPLTVADLIDDAAAVWAARP